MSILSNFRNPWEADKGVLESDVLGTAVLEGNVIEAEKSQSYYQSIIPTAYIFTADDGLTSTEVNRVKEEVNLIFKKNGFKLDIKIVSQAVILEKEKKGLGKYELGISLIDNYGDSIGNSEFLEDLQHNSENKPVYYYTDKLLLHDNQGYIESWVAYQHARKIGVRMKYIIIE